MCVHLTSLYLARFIKRKRHKLMCSFVNAPCGISVRGHELKKRFKFGLGLTARTARQYLDNPMRFYIKG